MGFRCGIVGLPNVGKSTIFNALTAGHAAISNYPFCTIEPNTGIVSVPDERLGQIHKITRTEKCTPTTMEFVDIAGLVQGASHGEGLGNQFLASIREMDAIAHVVRCFQAENIVHVNGSVDPARDIQTIETELLLADLEWTKSRWDKAQKNIKAQKKEAPIEAEIAQACLKEIEHGHSPTALAFNEEQQKVFRSFNLLSAKPVVLVLNVDENQIKQDNNAVGGILDHAKKKGWETVKICGQIEAEIIQLALEDRGAFMDELGLKESGLVRLIQKGYRLLDLLSFFTTVHGETKAWTVPRGTKAPQAAGKIHTDFEKGFIRAEVVACEDFIAFGGEAGARAKGHLRIEGKDYAVRDGDVIFFRFNV